jgi:hypothetical protein
MGEETEDAVELELPSKAAAIAFIHSNITGEASNIEVVKHTADDGYTGKASGLPS